MRKETAPAMVLGQRLEEIEACLEDVVTTTLAKISALLKRDYLLVFEKEDGERRTFGEGRLRQWFG